MGAGWAGVVGEQGTVDEQQRDKGRNPSRLQWFGISPLEAAIQGGEEFPGLGLHTHTLAHHVQDTARFLHFLNISGIIITMF